MATESHASTNTKAHYYQLFVLLTLYFAQGLPSGFITQALPAILRQYQVSLINIGWSGLVLIPWGVKFLWAPLVDKHFSLKWGRSRSWILPLQAVAVALLIGIAFFNPTHLTSTTAVLILYGALFLLSFVGATQDIATDGLATRLLKFVQPPATATAAHPTATHRQNQGNAMQVVGYRAGLIIGGGVLLMGLDIVGWRVSFLLMALLVALNSVPIWVFSEPSYVPPNTASNLKNDTVTHNKSHKLNFAHLKTYVITHYGYFWSAKELRAWLMVLLTYKVAEGLASGMVKPMMVDLGASLSEIGIWVTIIGSGASLVGAGLATWLMRHLARKKALVIANLLQIVGAGSYGLIAYAVQQGFLKSLHWLYLVNALEHLFASFALVAMLTSIMHYARHEHAGSDFTVQVCVMTVLSGGSHFVSGYLAHWLGYPMYFATCMGIGMALFLPIIYWYKLANN